MSSFQQGPAKSGNGLGAAETAHKGPKNPQIVNPTFTDGGTLHALCLTSPLLNVPEKAQKGSGLEKTRNCLGALEKVRKRSGSHPKGSETAQKSTKS